MMYAVKADARDRYGYEQALDRVADQRQRLDEQISRLVNVLPRCWKTRFRCLTMLRRPISVPVTPARFWRTSTVTPTVLHPSRSDWQLLSAESGYSRNKRPSPALGHRFSPSRPVRVAAMTRPTAEMRAKTVELVTAGETAHAPCRFIYIQTTHSLYTWVATCIQPKESAMAGPKITRLGDPANPYGRKRTPTTAPTPAQQAVNRARSQAGPERGTSKPAPKPAQPSGGIRQRQIDEAVDRAVMGRAPRKR